MGGGYKYRVGTHNGASSSSNPHGGGESTQLLVNENRSGESRSSSWSSKVVATSVVTFVGVSCVMAVRQKMDMSNVSSSSRSSAIVPEPGVSSSSSSPTDSLFAKTAGWFREFSAKGKRSEENLSSLLGSEHYTLKDVADSFRQLEYERDKMRGQSNSLHVFSWTPQAGFEMFDLGPTKEAALKDASIDRWQRPGWTFDFI